MAVVNTHLDKRKCAQQFLCFFRESRQGSTVDNIGQNKILYKEEVDSGKFTKSNSNKGYPNARINSLTCLIALRDRWQRKRENRHGKG